MKSYAGRRIVLHLSRQELQRDMAMQLEVFGFIDHTHPAAAELRENAIMRDRFADHFACVAVRRRTSYVPSFVPAGSGMGASRLSLLDKGRNK